MSRSPAPLRASILSREQVLERFGRPRRQRLVFTNGCFDLLHRGHVEYLDAARRLGDTLLVAVNGDDSVRRLKGAGRPVVPAADRCIVLAGLAAVDAVTVFDEETPAALIAALLPDVLVKGGDYSADQVVGREAVEGAGGSVVIVPHIAGTSTSEIIGRIEEGAHGR